MEFFSILLYLLDIMGKKQKIDARTQGETILVQQSFVMRLENSQEQELMVWSEILDSKWVFAIGHFYHLLNSLEFKSYFPINL